MCRISYERVSSLKQFEIRLNRKIYKMMTMTHIPEIIEHPEPEGKGVAGV